MLWMWWVVLLLISLLGIFYRLARILVPPFSRHLLTRKIHGNQLSTVYLSSGDCFVLEMVVDNLSETPKLIDQVLVIFLIHFFVLEYAKKHYSFTVFYSSGP